MVRQKWAKNAFISSLGTFCPFPFHLPFSYLVTGSNSISLLHQWDKNRQVHNDLDERFQELENGSLSITEVRIQDAGTYGCTAGNKGGLSRYT